ncbi:hypothetical protein X801_02175, partial [Opisthorchis viverrini]
MREENQDHQPPRYSKPQKSTDELPEGFCRCVRLELRQPVIQLAEYSVSLCVHCDSSALAGPTSLICYICDLRICNVGWRLDCRSRLVPRRDASLTPDCTILLRDDAVASSAVGDKPPKLC